LLSFCQLNLRKKNEKIILICLAGALFSLSGLAQAELIVNRYALLASGVNFSTLQNAINYQTPTFGTATPVIDFAESPTGDRGLFDGFSSFPGGSGNYFGLHIFGFLKVETAGTYTFRTTADDWVQLKVDGEMRIKENRVGTFSSPPLFLNEGLHAIDFKFLEGSGTSYVELSANFNKGAYALLGTEGFETVPEPATVALMGLGLLGFATASRRKSAKSKNA